MTLQGLLRLLHLQTLGGSFLPCNSLRDSNQPTARRPRAAQLRHASPSKFLSGGFPAAGVWFRLTACPRGVGRALLQRWRRRRPGRAGHLPPGHGFSDPTHLYLSKMHLIRLLFRGFASLFSLNLGEIRGLNLSLLGVGPPQNGLTIDLPHRVLVDVASAIRTFCTGRPIRSANDLARPFR